MAAGNKSYLCNFDIIYLEVSIWMRLLGVEDLLYGDWSKSVFPVCALSWSEWSTMASRQGRTYLSGSALASLLRASHEAASICPTLGTV